MKYSFINVIGLSLGLASAMLIILYVKDEEALTVFMQMQRKTLCKILIYKAL